MPDGVNTDELPKGWAWAALGELAADEPYAITDGPFGSNLKSEHYTESGPRVLRLQNIGDGLFRDEYAHISEQHFQSLKKHEARSGDLVIAALGETLPRACIVPDWVGPAIVKADCIRFKANAAILCPRFLCFALNSDPVRRRTATIIHGVGRPRLNQSEIKSVQIPIAPLAEQRRIVAKVEELFSDLDAGVAALTRVRANLKRYRASVLRAAVEGRLTADWRAAHPDAEPASALLARVLADRRAKWETDQLAKFAAADKNPPKGWQAKYAEPAAPDTATLPPLPEGWGVASLDQLATVITSGSRDWSQYYGAGSGTFLMAQNVRPGRLDLSFRQAVNPPENDRDRIRSQVAADDLLITIVGANTGDVCRVPEELPEHYVCQSVTLIRLVTPAYSRYLEAYLTSAENGQKQFKRYIYGAGRPHLSFDQLRMTAVYLPPLAEQERIVSEVEERLSVASAVERQVVADLARAGRLRQAILKRAFAGALVPQDPTDEPASALLERLRASRAEAAPSARKPKRGSAPPADGVS